MENKESRVQRLITIPPIPAALAAVLVYLQGMLTEDNSVALWASTAIGTFLIVSVAFYAYREEKNRSRGLLAGYVIGVIIMNLLLGIAAWGVQTALTARRRGEVRGEEEQARRGLLLPGNLEAPNFQGTVFPDSAMKIFYGKKCAGWTEGDTFVALRHSGNEDLLLTRTDDGIAIQTRFFDRSGKLIGKMDGNEFTFTSEDDLLTVHRPEDHVLVVKDRANVEVLYVAYLNPTTIQIRTDFYMSNGSRLNVKDDEIFVVTPAGGRIHFHDQGFSPNGVLKINLDGSIGIGPAAPLISPPAP